MKKNKPIDPFSQYPTVPGTNNFKEQLKDILNGPRIDYTLPPIRKNQINDKHIVQLDKLDEWCEKWLTKNKEAKVIRGEYYPYKDYTAIDELLRKHGKPLIDKVLKECPLKRHDVKYEIYDSLAFTIFRRKVDPKSLIDIPTYGSFWDRISDHGHA